MERTHTLVFRQRGIQTGRESQTKDLAEKTKERATGLPSLVQLGRTLTQKGVEV